MIDPFDPRLEAFRWPRASTDHYPKGNEGYWRIGWSHKGMVSRSQWERWYQYDEPLPIDLDATADAMEVLALASRSLPFDGTPAILNGIGKEIVEHAWHWLERSVRKHLTGGGAGREGRAL